jgi:hypothetical protein
MLSAGTVVGIAGLQPSKIYPGLIGSGTEAMLVAMF